MTDTPPVCDYEGSDYQTAFWDQANRAYEDGCEAVALRRLLPAHGLRLLELGAGAGRNSPRYKGFDQVWLVDYSRTQLEQARDRLGLDGRYRFFAADVYHLPFTPGIFDAATMIRTLHHMADPVLALAQARLALADGGTFILEYANKQNLKAIFRHTFGKQDWNPFTLEPVEFARLNYDFHPRAVRAWLEGLGFHIQSQLTVSHFRIAPVKRLIPAAALIQLDALAQKTGKYWQFSPSVFVRSVVPATFAPAALAFRELFICPLCRVKLSEPQPAQYSCPNCRRSYPTQDGITDFRAK